jgi:hypothetical protein
MRVSFLSRRKIAKYGVNIQAIFAFFIMLSRKLRAKDEKTGSVFVASPNPKIAVDNDYLCKKSA